MEIWQDFTILIHQLIHQVNTHNLLHQLWRSQTEPEACERQQFHQLWRNLWYESVAKIRKIKSMPQEKW